MSSKHEGRDEACPVTPAGRRVTRVRSAGASGGRGGGAGGARARGGQGGGAWGRWCDVGATQERGAGANARRGRAVGATRAAGGGEGQRGRCVLAGGGAPRRRGRREGGRRCGLGAIAARGVSPVPWSHFQSRPLEPFGAIERLAARASALSAGGPVRRLAVDADGSTAVSVPHPPPLPWSSPSVTGLQEDQSSRGRKILFLHSMTRSRI